LKAVSIGRSLTALAICLMFLLVFLVHITQVPTAYSWSAPTHQFIASTAIDLMPDNENWFFSTYSTTIVNWSPAPDQWKSSDPNEGDRHFYDYDFPHGESKPDYGVLPWAVEDNFNTFVQCLRENDWTHAAQLAGVIAHYIGDASMPLHATSDYNPGNNHGAYETTVNSHFGEMNMAMPEFVPQQLENVFDSTMQLLYDSYGYTGYTPDKLSYWLAQDILWNDTIKGITENRLRTSAQFLANIWYTGMVQANLVGVASLVNAITPYWRTSTSIPFTITATASTGVHPSDLSASSVSLYYRYSIDESSWGGWTFFENDNSAPWEWSFTAPQGDGYYEFYSIARDNTGNVESPWVTADARCCVDRAAPTSSVNMISPYWQTSTSFQITATASDAASGVKNVSLYYRYSIDNLSWGSWTFFGIEGTSWSWSFGAPSGDGHYQFYSIAKDMTGNAESAPTEADARCGVDNAAPLAPAKSSPADGTITNNNKPTFTWAAATDDLSGIAKYELWVDDNLDFSSPEILENTADNATTNYTPTTELADDNYSWRVRAWDQTDNPSQFESAWTLSINSAQLGVLVSISPSEDNGVLGDTVTFTVTVTNTGEVADNYDLTITDDAEWGATLSENELLNVENGASGTVTVSVTIPSGTAENVYTEIEVTATSRADPTVKNSATCVAHCLVGAAPAGRGVQVTISENKSGKPGDELSFTVVVTNTGTGTDTFSVTAEDTENWALTVSPTSFSLNAGGSRNVGLTVTIPSTAADGDSTTITVTATGTGYDNYASCTATAVAGGTSPFVYVGVVVVIVVILGAVLIFIKPF